jgi:HEPN domain-containing protein
MDYLEKIEYWFDLAEEDLITAEIVLIANRYLHFGFLCHLTIEKAIKAYHWFNIKSEPQYTHNLLTLSKNSNLNELLTESQKKLIYNLMPLNIEARYPSNKKEISKTLTKEYCEKLFIETKEFILWMKILLKK